MKKRRVIAFVAVAVVLAGAVSAGAQLRLDANLNWPLVGGIQLDPTIFGSTGGSLDLSQYHLLLPDFRLYYQFGTGFLQAGIGIRAYTLIIESLVFPEAFIEMNLKPFVLSASLGGYLFGVFGIVNNGAAANLILPDLSAYWSINNWFRIGGGILLFAPLNASGEQNFGYLGYLGAKFSFLFR